MVGKYVPLSILIGSLSPRRHVVIPDGTTSYSSRSGQEMTFVLLSLDPKIL